MIAEISEDLVGRSEPLAVLESALEDLAAGRGRSLLIEGEPGIGKSALLSAGLIGASAAGFEVLRGVCDDLGHRFPLAVMVQALGVSAGSADLARAQTAAGFAQAGFLVGEGAQWNVPMLAGDPVVAGVERLLELVDRLCAAGPVVFAVDDLQWADDASLLFWRRLSRATAQLPLVLVGTARSVPQRADLDGLRRDLRTRGGVQVDLGPLAQEQVSALAASRVGGRPGPRLAARLAAAAGNPLYVLELLETLGRVHALTVSDGVAELADVDDSPGADPAARSLAGVITDHLGFLSADCRSVLRAAAVLGPDFSAADLEGVADRTVGVLVGLLEEAIATGVLEAAGVRLRFRHGLIRQALYEATPPAVRAVMLRRAARWLIASGAAAERVAGILLLSADAVEGWELDWLLENVGALVGRAPAVAAELLELTLRHTAEDDPRYPAIQDHLAVVALHLAKYELVEEITSHILNIKSLAMNGLAGSDRRGQAAWILGTAMLRTGRFAEAAPLALAAREDPSTAPLWRARLSTLSANIHLSTGRVAEACEEAVRALAEGEALSDPMTCGYALHVTAGERIVAGDVEAAVAMLEQGVAVIGSDPQLVDLRISVMSNLGACRAGLDRFQEAADVLAQAWALGERIGAPRLAQVQMQSSALAFDNGRWDDAIAGFDAVAELGRKAYQRHAVLVHGVGAIIAIHRDDAQAVARHLAELRDEETSAKALTFNSIYLSWAEALAAERAGRTDKAIETLTAVLDADRGQIADRIGVLPMVTRLALDSGDRHTAERAVSVCAVDAQEESSPWTAALAGWCRGLLDADPAALLEAGAYFRAANRPLGLGNVLEDAAVEQARAGSRDAARATLAEVLSVYTGLGAVWDSRRALSRLRAHGLRVGARGPHTRALTGLDSLTAAERRVAELVAKGNSNTEIAERLVLSRRTVETHVSHVLAKLSARSRREIATLVLP